MLSFKESYPFKHDTPGNDDMNVVYKHIVYTYFYIYIYE